MTERDADPRPSLPPHIDPTKPAGNAQFDPRQQTVRRDMPRHLQGSQGAAGRGSAPSQARDRSHQPERHDTDDWGFAERPSMTMLTGPDASPPRPIERGAPRGRARVARRPYRLLVWGGVGVLAATIAVLALRERARRSRRGPVSSLLFLLGLEGQGARRFARRRAG